MQSNKLAQIGGGKQRDSNLELLRIVSMILVLMSHYIPSRNAVTAESLYNSPVSTLFTLELRSISMVCVNCFILISGYYGIKWKKRSFLNLIYQLLFWGVIGYMISYFFGNHQHGLSLFVTEQRGYYTLRWFVSAYLSLYFLAPLLNSFIEHTTEHQLGLYVIIFYTFSTVFGYLIGAEEFNEGMSMISLIGIYMIGAYLKKSTLHILSYNKWVDLAVYLVLGFVMVAASAFLLSIHFNHSIYGYLNPIIILESLFLFSFFRKWKIPYNKAINSIAISAFAAFLFHTHPCLCGYFRSGCNYLGDSSLFPLALVFLIAIFMVGVLIDKLRIVTFNALWKAFKQSSNTAISRH